MTNRNPGPSMPLYWDSHGRVPPGNIVSGLREGGSLAGFADVRDMVAPPADVAASLSDLTRTGARLPVQRL